MPRAKERRLFQCATCGKGYTKRKALRLHTETHDGVLCACDQCDVKCNGRNALRYHKQTAHAVGGPFECDKCEKKYERRDALRYHKQTAHAENGPLECDECGKLYPNRRVLNSHKRLHREAHKDKLHECDQCEKTYKRRDYLLEHKRNSHAEAGHFECNKCGKVFARKSALRTHKRIHSDGPCECDVCGTTHRNPPALAAHKRRLHSEYQCTRCPRTFKTCDGREDHMQNEHSDTRFACDSECGLHSATPLEDLEHPESRRARQHPITCKCASVDWSRAQKVAWNLASTAFVVADGTMKCTDGDCDFATTCARQMETHKEQCHRNTYKPVLQVFVLLS